jgi:uncharacterized membrane protein (UPF0182 family)
VPGGSNNLASYMSVDSDYGPNYGKITVLEVPTKATVQGPAQVANVFKSNTTISKDISLLSTGQSEVLHGNLLTLPVGKSFLYVEPLYVQSSGGSAASYPTLQRVLVTYGDKVGYGATLTDALNDITKGLTAGSSLGSLGQTSTPGGGTSSTPPSSSSPPASSSSPPSSPTSSSSAPPPPATQQQILSKLATVNQQLDAAKTSGDLVRIAQLQVQEQQLVEKLLALQSGSASPSGSGSAPK